MLYYLLAFVIFLYFIHIIFNYNRKARLLRKIPGPELRFIIGNALEFMHSPVDIMKVGREFARIWDGIYRVYSFPVGSVFIYNPEDIEIITSNMKYSTKSVIYNFLKPWLRDGLLISQGTKWQERRKILTPAFHFNVLRQFSEVMVENSQRMVADLKQTVGRPIDVVPVLSEFTLNSICETAMGTRLSEDDTEAGRSYKKAIYDLGHYFVKRFLNVWYYSDFIFNLTPLARQQIECLKIVHGFTENVIKDRKVYVETHGFNIPDVDIDNDTYVYKRKKKTAMLDLLISAEKEGVIDRVGVQEEVDTFMFEGHDTTAAGLTFCFMLLANHKKIQNYRPISLLSHVYKLFSRVITNRLARRFDDFQLLKQAGFRRGFSTMDHIHTLRQDKIVAELQEIFEDCDRPIKMEDLPKMKYMECCIKESMRLYPPVHLISRKLNEDVVLSNYTVPAGALCHISINDLHRRPDLFPNPEQFDPDRFLPENSVGRHPYAYLPFSAGPRNCIGQKFAMMEMKVAVAEVLRHFELSPVTRPEDIQISADIVLRNDGPVHVHFVKRW